MRSDYDDDETLTRYVLTHYGELLAPLEARALSALALAEKSRMYGSARHAALVRKLDVGDLLAEGPDACRQRIRDRLLVEHSARVFVNRCARCRCIVRTPGARQCFWCGHDWH
jgi:hypothetical protein